MFNVSSLRYRYTQFFVLSMLCSLIYAMVQSIGPGVANFQDNLYKKDFLIAKANLLRTKLGDRILPRALLGKDGWVEYTGEGNIDDFQNLTQFGHRKALLLRLKAFAKYLESQDITLLIVVAPNKATIYPDKLPEQIKTLPTESRLDRLIAFLEENDLPIIVDLRPSLLAARENQDVYFKQNNTHWNGYGAFVAYTTTVNALRISYPQLKPYEATDLKFVTDDHDARLRDSYFAPQNPFVQTLHLDKDNSRYQFEGVGGYNQFSSIPDSSLPTLLMFHDSFGAYYLNEYLSMNFGKSHFIHMNNASQYLSKESIQLFEPDIIIIETVERYLDVLIPALVNFTP